MAKKDINKTKDLNSPGSRSEKRAEKEKALKALERAKAMNRPVIFIKQGQSQYFKELTERGGDASDLLISRSAAEYLMISYHTFAKRLKKVKIPHITKKGNHRYFKTSDLDKFKNQILNA